MVHNHIFGSTLYVAMNPWQQTNAFIESIMCKSKDCHSPANHIFLDYERYNHNSCNCLNVMIGVITNDHKWSL